VNALFRMALEAAVLAASGYLLLLWVLPS